MSASAHSIDLERFPAHLRGVVEGMISVHEQAVSDLTERNAAPSTQNMELEAVNTRLEHMVKELNHLLHGPKSERFTKNERQLAFEDFEVATAETQVQSDTIEMKTPRKKRRPPQRNLGYLPDHLERIE